MDIPRCRECNAQIQASRVLCRKCGKKASRQGMCARCGLKPKEQARNVLGLLLEEIYEYCAECLLVRKEQFEKSFAVQLERMSEPEREPKKRCKIVKPEKPGTALPWD